jgi:DNA-binding PadR family transcriptional regulator
MRPDTRTQVLQRLLTEPQGLSEPEIRRQLHPRVSQPTLWRILNALRAAGFVVVEGRARATRYHAADRIDRPTLRSRRLHQHVAERLARETGLRELARERLEKLRQVNPHGRRYHDRWAELLDGPLPALLRTLTEASAQSDDLRKESPFTTLIDKLTRERIFRSIRAA